VEAIDYLRGKQLFEKVASSTLPGLLVLDLEMPRLDGFGVLEWLRKHPHLRPSRVVVITSAQNDQDLARAHRLGADLCLLKSSDPTELAQLVQTLQECSDSHAGFTAAHPESAHTEFVSH
jgi:two-component system response regulator